MTLPRPCNFFESGMEPMAKPGALEDDPLPVTTMTINDDSDSYDIKWGGMMMTMTSQTPMMLQQL